MFNVRAARAIALTASALGLCAPAFGQVSQTVGPDIIVGDFPDLSNNPPTAVNGVMYDSFAVGTTSCNRGSTPVNWFTGTGENRHPAISQNLFRLSTGAGRFEQMGQGSLKHGFTALQGTTCTGYFTFGCTPTAGTTLGTGCSDPYCCGLNNSPGDMGPKWQVNAASGLFPYAYPSNPDSGPIRVRLADLNAAGITGNRFFVEAAYIVGDDAAAGNKNNNASWREVTMTSTGAPPAATNFTLSSFAPASVMHREQPAIYAWQAIDPTVTITTFDVPSDGRFILACKVSGPTSGQYSYEYALFNQNSERCAGSFIVPLPGTQSSLTNVGFHDVEAVGEPNALANPNNPAADDWTVSGADAGSSSVSWSGPAYSGTLPVYTMDSSTAFRVASFTAGTGIDHSANVIRWGMMFNFRFTSEIAPGGTGSIAVGLWRPGTGTAFVMSNVATPGGATVGTLTATCCGGLSCTVTNQGACTGNWGLPGTTCSPNPCIVGACCLPNLTCSQFNSGVCSAQGGTYQGDGSTCQSSPCPTGACCNNSTAGCTIGGTSCPAGSTYMGLGTTCASVTCTATEYCLAGSDACGVTNADERISEVIFNTIDKVSGTGNGPAGCYSDFRANSTMLVPGQSYAITVRNASAYEDDQAAVWIDWNHNLGFLDTAEQFTLVSANAGSTFTGTVTVPAAALPGSTRMRVRVTFTGALSPCGNTTYGEVEDYSVVVAASGICCRGSTCNASVTQAACVGSGVAGAVFVASASSCNAAGSASTPCCHADYNKVNGVGVQDIFDFLNDWFAGSAYARFGGNGAAAPLAVQNIFDFLAAWFAGGC